MSRRSVPQNAPRIERDAPIDPLQGTAYRAVRWVGRGGMGEVLEAEHRRLGKRVVVKLLGAQHGRRRDLDDRLRLEAQTLARLDHPNLVAVHDMGRTPAGRAYMVMERLEGCTLGVELHRRGALPWLEAVDIACQLLDALEAAHRAGVVHRDVKLDNVFLCAAPGAGARPAAEHGGRRCVKLLDFGIAKVLSPESAGLDPVCFRTDDSVAVGTPRSFSPEQALGNRVDARTDVYGAGILLYALLTGRGPFDHLADPAALAHAHTTQAPPPPSRWSPQLVPRELERVVLRALAKQPAHRPHSAAAFAQTLRDIAAARGSGLPPASPMAGGAAAVGDGHAAARVRDGQPLAPAAPAAPAAAVPPARSFGRRRRASRRVRDAVTLCLVILVGSAVAAGTGAGLAHLQAGRRIDFFERSRAVVTMDAGASEARVKGVTHERSPPGPARPSAGGSRRHGAGRVP